MLKNAPPSFHLLTKPTGAICNLDCEFRMADDLQETYIQQLLASRQTPEVTIDWQCGEPTLMGLEFFHRSIELVKTYKQPEQMPGESLPYDRPTAG